MTLNQARDVAAIILIVEMFVLGLIPLVLFYMAIRGLQRFVPRIHYWLRVARGWILQAEMIVTTSMRWLVAPIVFASGLSAGLREGITALKRR